MSNKNQLLEKEDKTVVKNPENNLIETKSEFVETQTKEKNINSEKVKLDLKEESPISNFIPVKIKNTDVLSIFTLLVIIFISILLTFFTMFTIYNAFNTNIISGVHIKGMDVSGLSASDAKYQLENMEILKVPSQFPKWRFPLIQNQLLMLHFKWEEKVIFFKIIYKYYP